LFLFCLQCLAQFDGLAVQPSGVISQCLPVLLRVYFPEQFAFLIEVFDEFGDGSFAEAESGFAKMPDEQQDGELAVLNVVSVTLHLRRMAGRMLKRVVSSGVSLMLLNAI
jgi:hypothetical protein